DGELAEPSKADDQHPSAWFQPRGGASHRPVRSQAGVSERGSPNGVQRTEREQVTRLGDEHCLGVAAVDLEAWRLTGRASLLIAGSAFSTLSATPSAEHQHRVVGMEPSGLQVWSRIGPPVVDPPRNLMA